jgi:uncharacterized membrane protein YqjE
MSLVWLVVWFIEGQPRLTAWNGWLIALVVCIVLDACSRGRRPGHSREGAPLGSC